MKTTTTFVVLLSVIWLALVGCGGVKMTPEYINAKKAIERNDWEQAKDLLEKEVAKNKGNYEAWYFLGTARKQLGDVKGMLDAYSVAEKGVDEKYRVAMNNTRFSAWAEMYNTSVDIYNRFADNTDIAKIDKGIETMNNAIALKPELPENYSLLGMMYEGKGDTIAAIRAYEKYAELQKPAIDLAKSKGMSLNILRDKALNSLGQAETTKGMRSGNDSLLVDYIRSGSDTVYMYSIQKDKSGFVAEGWRVNPPSSWTAQERERYAPINVRPFTQLGSLYYNRREYDKALKYIDILSILKPSDEQAQNLKVQIYQDQGKMDEALSSLSGLVQSDPKNKYFLSNYALALFRTEKLDEAIAQYEKALQIDPDYDVALFNAAAALKNRAAQFQKEERDRRDKDSKYKENEQRYFPLLTKAAEYFDRYRKLPAHRDDLTAVEHMVNIYETTRDKPKVKQMTTELEAMEYVNSSNPRYWEILGGVYARSNQTDKAEKSFKKADDMRKNQK